MIIPLCEGQLVSLSSTNETMIVWVFFLLLVFALLALDLGVFHKKDKVVTVKESLAWTGIWVTVALVFGGVIYYIYEVNFMGINTHHTEPYNALIDFYTGYLIEESLSLDNIFVMALIFSFFKIEGQYQHNILFWGIIGAVFFRMVMIVLGTAFVETFEWATYIFGGILIFSAFKMIKGGEEDEDFEKNIGVRLLQKIYPIDWKNHNGSYFTTQNGKRVATGLLAALVVIEFSDILFAVDSIPAIFSITTDSFIVFTSNIFAILGLRSLYFFLAGMLDKFEYMKYSLVGVLMFVGIKMLLVHFYEIPALLSLGIIVFLLTSGVVFSVLHKDKPTQS
jgi:tellurite resistance protein TerC